MGVLTAWHAPQPTIPQWLRWLPAAAIGVYFIVIGTAFMAYRLQAFSLAPDPRTLRAKYLQRPEVATQRAAFNAITTAFECNIPLIQHKVVMTWLAFGSLLVEAALVAAILLIEVTTLR